MICTSYPEYNHIKIEIENFIATVWINREDKRNSLAALTLNELEDIFYKLENDNNIRIVIITGAGNKAFCSGADIEDGFESCDIGEMVKKGQNLFNQIEQFPKPVIAAVNGYALGGGCELMMSCDIIIAGKGISIGQPEIQRGIMPGWGATQRMPKLVGKHRTLELILQGGRIKAEEALSIGLVNKLVPRGTELENAKELADRLKKHSLLGLRMIKNAVVKGMNCSIEKGLKIEAENFLKLFTIE